MSRNILIFGNGDKSPTGFPTADDLIKYIKNDPDRGIFTVNLGRYRYTLWKNADVIVLSRDGLAYGHFDIARREKPNSDDRRSFPPVKSVYIVSKSTVYKTPVKLSSLGIIGKDIRFGKLINKRVFEKIQKLAERTISYDDHRHPNIRPASEGASAFAGNDADAAAAVKLVRVKMIDEIADNFIRFQQDARRHKDRTRRILRRTEYWVHDKNSGAFGPGKFLGYRDMDFATYEQASADNYTGTKFNGGTARLNIQRALGYRSFAANVSLEAKCRKWGTSLLGADAWGGASAGKWKFLTLPIPGREPITDFPDQITQPERLPEGASKIISVNAYERSRKARDHCIRHYGTRCCVCEMDFKERYGELGIGFIHVHHLKMLSEIGAEYEIDPIKDLRPVCPNCHAMLHRTAPPLSIDELRLRLKIPTPD